MVSLEKELFSAFDRLGISGVERNNYLKYLGELHDFDSYKWGHCIRVGLGCEALVKKYFSGWPVKEIFGAGVFNDIGVLEVDVDVVKKANVPNSNFTAEDYEKMKTHVVKGYDMIVNDFPDEARIMLFHHMITRGYPEVLPERSLECRVDEDDARKYGHLVELVDFADSLNRNNGRFGELDMEGRKEILIKAFLDYEKIVKESYGSGIFS